MLAGAAWFVMRKSSAAGNLIWSPGQISDISSVGTNPTMQISVIAQNTSNTELLLNSFAGNLYANGTLIGNVSNFLPTVIAGNTQTPVPLTLTLLPLGLVNDLINAFINKTAIQNLDLEGMANVNSFQVPVPLKFTLNV